VHLPVIGTPILFYFVWQNRNTVLNSQVWKTLFLWFVILSILTSIAYFSGPQTADYLKDILQVYPQDIIESHALWGRIAFVIQAMMGLIGIMGLSSILQGEKPSAKLPFILIILLLINVVILIWTAHLGGMVRRPDLG
jgi:hypothetical protein